jgi:hypothetical protein
MPGATLHLTHAEMLAEDSAVAAPLREAMQQELLYAKLGAVLVDLPFYTNILPMMLGYWLEMPGEKCPFAQQMHRHHPDLFAWHVLTESHRDHLLSRSQRLAIMAGFFSHVALDLEIHPLVNWCARRDVILHGGNESHQHRLTEKYQSLFFHRETQGEDIVGSTRLFTEKTQIVDFPTFFRLDIDRPVVRWVTDLLGGFYHESAPSMRQFAGWIRAFRHFAFSICLPMARKNSNRLGNETNRQLYFENETFSFMEYFDRAYRRSVTLLNQAYDLFASGEFDQRSQREFLLRAQITNLAEPPERGLLPALPEYGGVEVELGVTA